MTIMLINKFTKLIIAFFCLHKGKEDNFVLAGADLLLSTL